MSRWSYDRLTAFDAGYLTRETAAQPLHFVLQLDVGGELTVDDVRRHVTARLGALPELHRRLRYPLLGGRPVWVDDPDFAVERHVVQWQSPVAGPDDAEAALAAISMERLPRDRPLWRLSVGSGPRGRTTLWLSVHHAMMDGSLLSTVLSDLFGTQPVSGAAHELRRAPSRLLLLSVVVARRLARTRRSSAASQSGPAPAPAAQTGPAAVPRVLTGTVSDQRAVAGFSVPLADVLRARRATGRTVNDLFLAATTEGLRGYLPGWTVDGLPRDVTALVPRDVRGEDEARAIGNRGWSMLVVLPVTVDDPGERLEIIAEQTAAGKASAATSGTSGWSFDIALSNVRLGGPHEVAGCPVVGHRVGVPLQGDNRVVAVATSREDELTVSFTADGDAFADVAVLAELAHKALVAWA